ncbi:MAG: DNA-directed RNA polymerase sigma-70 factor [Saprospiraceae bacterium]|nr:MAG: DNA-directed RNA polymerase sigma-70 factor [Saprospiraceae bacterium]
MHPTHSDQELKDLMQQDGEKAIEQLFRMYYTYLCHAVYRVLGDPSLVEDLVQEVFFELWRKKDSLQINISIKAYLRRAAVNKALNFIRDQKIKFEEEDRAPVQVSKINSVVQKLEAAELQVEIDKVIDSLPDRCRVVFVLSRYEEMSYQEIADHLGISAKTVENQISKALKILRKALNAYL